jgi:hypothetical protein
MPSVLRKVRVETSIAKPPVTGSLGAVTAYLGALHRTLFQALIRVCEAVNALVNQGNAPTQPVNLSRFTVATLPDETEWVGGVIAVTNEAGGFTVAFSDGTNWRRVQDRAIVS